MKALILAAGYATRLYPITKEYPKPLLTVGKRPIINYILDKLRVLAGLDEIVIVTNSKFIRQFRKWARQIDCSKRINLVNDLTKNHSDRLGAIGDINFVINKKHIKDDLLVIGGDNLFDGDLKQFICFAKKSIHHPVIGVYNIKDIRGASKYGVVKLAGNEQIIDFKEKPKRPESPLVAMCLYYFPKETLGLIREYLNNKTDKHDATGFYIDWLRKQVPVYGFIFNKSWYDIGDHRFYDEAKKRFPQK